jgi:hypothetical protein
MYESKAELYSQSCGEAFMVFVREFKIRFTLPKDEQPTTVTNK